MGKTDAEKAAAETATQSHLDRIERLDRGPFKLCAFVAVSAHASSPVRATQLQSQIQLLS